MKLRSMSFWSKLDEETQDFLRHDISRKASRGWKIMDVFEAVVPIIGIFIKLVEQSGASHKISAKQFS